MFRNIAEARIEGLDPVKPLTYYWSFHGGMSVVVPQCCTCVCISVVFYQFGHPYSCPSKMEIEIVASRKDTHILQGIKLLENEL